MRRIYVTFSGAAYDETTARIVRSGPLEGGSADEVWVYDDRWLLSTGFVDQHKWLWEDKPQHGYGGCAWKPYAILDAMKRADPGDLILYSDADTYPIADLTPIWNLAEWNGTALFEEQGCIVREWVKRDCLIAMGCDSETFYGSVIANGRFQVFTNCGYDQKFLARWLFYSTDRTAMLRGPSVLKPELPTYRRHCTEQAVLSLLARIFDIPLHRCPDQNGWPISVGCGQPEDDYPQLFIQQGRHGDKSDLSGSKYFHVPGVSR